MAKTAKKAAKAKVTTYTADLYVVSGSNGLDFYTAPPTINLDQDLDMNYGEGVTLYDASELDEFVEVLEKHDIQTLADTYSVHVETSPLVQVCDYVVDRVLSRVKPGKRTVTLSTEPVKGAVVLEIFGVGDQLAIAAGGDTAYTEQAAFTKHFGLPRSFKAGVVRSFWLTVK